MLSAAGGRFGCARGIDGHRGEHPTWRRRRLGVPLRRVQRRRRCGLRGRDLPGKRVVTGGGAFASGASSEARMVEIGPYAHQDAAASNRRAWTSEMVNDTGPPRTSPRTRSARAPGASRDGRPPVRRRPRRQSSTAKAGCPNAASVLGGGISNRAYPGARILATVPFDDGDKGSKPDDGWRVRTFIGDSRELQVFAICKETTGIVYRSRTGSAT